MCALGVSVGAAACERLSMIVDGCRYLSIKTRSAAGNPGKLGALLNRSPLRFVRVAADRLCVFVGKRRQLSAIVGKGLQVAVYPNFNRVSPDISKCAFVTSLFCLSLCWRLSGSRRGARADARKRGRLAASPSANNLVIPSLMGQHTLRVV